MARANLPVSKLLPRSSTVTLVAIALSHVMASCSSKDSAPPSLPAGPTVVLPPPTGDGGPRADATTTSDGGDARSEAGDAIGDMSLGDAARDGETDGGGDAETGPKEGAPVIVITSPSPVADPNAGVAIVTGSSVTVICSVQQSTAAGAKAVDGSSVQIEMVDPAGKATKSAGAPTDQVGEYQASFIFDSETHGRLTFRCTARDRSTPALEGWSTIETFVDQGPSIEVISPKPGSARQLTAAVPFEFTVKPKPLVATDPGAAVERVTVSTNGVDVTPTPDATGTYRVDVNYNDKTRFPQTPSGSIPVEITAKNSRTAAPATRTEAYKFFLDAIGPEIVIESPKQKAVLGGEIELVFTAKDVPAGLKKESVLVEIGSDRYPYDPKSANWSEKDGRFTFRFDSTSVTAALAQVTINVWAEDTVNNRAAATSLLLYLDHQPPYVSLDPANIREVIQTGPKLECSSPFDPLGSAASDLDSLLSSARFRVLAWDLTNKASGQTEFIYSDTNPNSVWLYLQSDPSVPLVVDSDGDEWCDEIPETLRSTLPSVHLNPIAAAGDAYFGSDATAEPPAPPDYCSVRVPPGQPPRRLCEDRSDLTRVIRHTMANSEPVIYGVDVSPGVFCTGTSWEVGNRIPSDGWVCLAARAQDKTRNVGVSAPIRLCYDDGNSANGAPTCNPGGATHGSPPSCTDGCRMRPPPDLRLVRRY